MGILRLIFHQPLIFFAQISAPQAPELKPRANKVWNYLLSTSPVTPNNHRMKRLLTVPDHRNPQARSIALVTLLLTPGFAALIWAAYVSMRLWRLSRLAQNNDFVASRLAAIPLAIVIGLALGVLVSLFWHNRHRLRAVFRPNLGRIIGAVILGFLTPIFALQWLPIIVIGLAVIVASNTPWVLALTLLPAIPWYPVSCLIISGVKSKWLRFALFSLMWWAALSTVILIVGIPEFRL